MAAAWLLPHELSAFHADKPAGLQLYTIRGLMKKDVPGTLESVSKIGYHFLEAAGYHDGKLYGMPPKKFRQLVDNLGMDLNSSHLGINKSNVSEVIEAHHEAGIKYIVLPWIGEDRRKSIEDYKKLAAEFNELGEKISQAGMKFGYHNHAFEFEKFGGDIPAYDILLKKTDPELVCMQLDLFWIVYAGYDPVDYFERFQGRFELWHVKDMDNLRDKKDIEVGKGTIDFQTIFDNRKESGMKYFYVELDNCPSPELECIQISYDGVQNLKF